MFCGECFKIEANAKYQIVEMCGKCGIVFSQKNSVPYVFDLECDGDSVVKVEIGKDFYYFLFPKHSNDGFFTQIKYKSQNLEVSLFNKLMITVSGELICEKNVENLTYSHFEICEDLCLIYFNGKRNFVVVIKEKELCFADYYDECNLSDDEKLFMCRLNDSLNHGKVCEIRNKEITTYLVYLDDYEMNLKEDFVALVFLDCVRAGNFKYCNQLLCEGLRMEKEEEIKNFFPRFDYLYPVSNNKAILINKNTLAGIFEFEIKNNQIVNIIHLR